MPDEPGHRNVQVHKRILRPRWWNTLALRLGVAVNATVIVVLVLSAWMDHRRDADVQNKYAMNRLLEETRVLHAAWSQFQDADSFQRFVDGFCRQMTTAASPGHHIAVIDANGQVLVRAHERANSKLEDLMRVSTSSGTHTFTFDGQPFAAHSMSIGDGANLIVAVSLQPVEEMLRMQGISRIATTGILVVIIFGVTVLCFFAWVRNPLREFVRVVSAVGERRFDQRVEPKGASEFRYLADGMNRMVRALGRTERLRASEMQRAREIQRALVGDRDLTVNGCRIRAIFLPAESVGGDFFDMVPLQDGSMLVAVIDVTGHGIPGALCTALLRSSLRHLARTTNDVGEIAGGLNRDLCDIAAAGVFATAIFVRLGRNSGTVEYANAGHDPPIFTTPDGAVAPLDRAGLLLGVEADTIYETVGVRVAAGSRLLIFTDGLHEAMSPCGEQYGRERVSELFAKTGHLPLDEQLAAALNAVRVFSGREDFEDDVTMIGICWADSPETQGLSIPGAAIRS